MRLSGTDRAGRRRLHEGQLSGARMTSRYRPAAVAHQRLLQSQAVD